MTFVVALACVAGAACGPQVDAIAEAAAARGGLAKLRASGTIHVRGSLRFASVAQPMEFEAYVDASSGAPRGFLSFRQAGAFRSTLLSGERGFERDERGRYHAVEGEELARLRGEVATLLVAARFPADGPWTSAGPKVFRRASDGCEVTLGAGTRPDSLTLRAASPELRRLEDWSDFDGVFLPRAIEARGDGGWRLERLTWQFHAFVVDSLFEPPSASEDPGVVLGGTTQGVTMKKAFVRSAPSFAVRFEPVEPAIAIESIDQLLALAGPRAAKQEAVDAVTARLDDRGRLIGWEVAEPTPASASRPAATTSWRISELIEAPLVPATIQRAIEDVLRLAHERGLKLEPFFALRVPMPGAASASKPIARVFELSARVLEARR